MKKKKTLFGQKVLEMFVVQGTTMFGLMIINIIVANYLGPEGKGALSLAMLVPTMLQLISGFGIHLANSYFLGRKKKPISELVSNSLVFTLVMSIVTIGIFIAVYPALRESFFDGVATNVIFLGLLILPFLHLDRIFSRYLLLRDQIHYYSWNNTIRILLNLGLVAVFLVFLGFGVYAALVAWIIANGVTALAAVVKIWVGEHVRWKTNGSLMGDMLKYGIKGYIGNVVYFINKRVDLLLVSFFLAIGDVGIYSVALALSEVLFQLPTVVTSLLFARVSVSTDKASNVFTPRIFRSMIWIMAFSGGAAALLASPIISLLFGEEFIGAVVPFYIIIPGVVLVGASTIIGSDLTGRGMPWIHSMISLVALVLNIVLNVTLIPQYGINGSALASTLSFATIAVITTVVYHHVTKTSYRDLLVLRKSDTKYFVQFLARMRLLPARYRGEE